MANVEFYKNSSESESKDFIIQDEILIYCLN